MNLDADIYAPLAPEQEYELIKKYKETGDKSLAKELVNRNLRYIYKLAVKYLRPESGLELEELINAGVIGLYEALESFDLSKKRRFLTYAHWKIFEHIFATANSYLSHLYLPQSKKKDLLIIYKVISDLFYELNRDPTVEEVFEELRKQGYKKISKDFVIFVMNRVHIPGVDVYQNLEKD